nr:MAG TPA: 50S ribosomal subunit [Caudoviricetes sp.]
MLRRPDITFEKLHFICPVCETELITDKCSKCGQLIDLDDFDVDVCPAEVLADHRYMEGKEE